MKNLSILCVIILFALSSCNGGTKSSGGTNAAVKPLPFPENSQQAKDNALIIDYIKAKNFKNIKNTNSGIYYFMEKEGTGEHPTASSRVKAHYHGELLNGTKFDSSYDRNQPLDFNLGQVVRGWGISIPLLKKGGKGKFIIPSDLAYGPRAQGKIPANSVLVFDIELVDFQ